MDFTDEEGLKTAEYISMTGIKNHMMNSAKSEESVEQKIFSF
jgi:hypothetical protein